MDFVVRFFTKAKFTQNYKGLITFARYLLGFLKKKTIAGNVLRGCNFYRKMLTIHLHKLDCL